MSIYRQVTDYRLCLKKTLIVHYIFQLSILPQGILSIPLALLFFMFLITICSFFMVKSFFFIWSPASVILFVGILIIGGAWPNKLLKWFFDWFSLSCLDLPFRIERVDFFLLLISFAICLLLLTSYLYVPYLAQLFCFQHISLVHFCIDDLILHLPF